jgi:hypothetical protein
VTAEAYFKRALKIREEQLGPTHSRVGQTLKHMITLYEMQERFKDALECGSRALTISENIFGSGTRHDTTRYTMVHGVVTHGSGWCGE